MKKAFNYLRDTFVAGLIFVLPLLIVFVLLSKVFKAISGIATKIASLFGLKSIVGISGGTIISGIGIILLCILCGYLMRISFFKSINHWLNKKLSDHIPGYTFYRDKALSTIEQKEEKLPYKDAAWVTADNTQQPCFVLEDLPNGKSVVFLPSGGNAKEGAIYLLPSDQLEICPGVDIKAFEVAINNRGLGLRELLAASKV